MKCATLLTLLLVLTCAHAIWLPTATARQEQPEASPLEEAEAEEWETSEILQSVPVSVLIELRALRQDVVTKGCPVNLCFALQGDKHITDDEYRQQKNFVDLVVAITTTDDRGNFCAVQYGRSNKAISALSKKKIKFLNKMQRSRRVGGSGSNIAGALAYAGFQVRTRARNPRKIILFGDGFSNIGAEPTEVAATIREEGTEICAIAVGDYDLDKLADITTSRNRVLGIRDYYDLGEIIVATVYDVCSYFDGLGE